MITIHKFRTASKQNIRTFALPFEPQPYTFKMNFEYDSWNRIQQMIYPDGEVVKYGYNCGGLLSSISGEMVRRISDVLQPASLQGNAVQTNGTIGGGMAPVNPPIGPVEQPTVTCRYPYIDSILYNKFELRDSVVYGNGTSTHYEYDSLQRLSRLRSYAALGIKMQDVAYTYDNASNITHIANTAGTMSGLGGGYERNYTYDNLYRLTSAEGNWSNRRTTLPDTLDMSYSPNGRILSKSVHLTTLIEGVQKDVSYASAYTYNDNNQLKYTTNDAGSIQQSFSWDGSGNMLTMSIPDNTRRTSVRTFSWTEDNRLQTALDKNWFSYYQYDAGGERTFKITWTGTTQSVNARQQTFYTPANATLYASPYLVITQQGYTKHYYAESERVVSKVGKDAFAGISNAVVSDSAVAVKRLAVSDDVALPERSTLPDSTRFAFLYTLSNQQESIAECYFYHTDHLGSASWITYTDGKPVQHLYYMPWGERLVDQRKSTYEGSLFAFSAKERDVETGLSYFGARYYSSDLSVWLSVDPMSDKYPSLSPYTYCANNPVKLVDPNGEEIGDYYDLNGNYLGNDQKKDGKIYVVTETPTGNTSVSPRDQYDEKNIFQVPSFENRKEIVDKLENFDRQRPNAEWGGVCGVGINPNDDMYGVEKVAWGNPSKDGNPLNSERLGYRQLNMKEIGINGFCVFFDYHSHGSGGWIQEPSNWFDSESGIWRGDIPNVTQRLQVSSGSRTFAVFAMEEKNVYFYTDKGICGKMDFNTFRNLGQ